jgi:hypothetical protein
MTRRFTLALFATFALSIVPGLAHPGHDHKILGTVTMAAADHVMVKDKADKEVTVYFTKETKVLKDKKPAQIADIQNGLRVVVTAVTVKLNGVERMNAKVIELGAAPTTK